MPLSGVRVVDLTRILAGPFATMLLGDLGADVVKVEHPRGGDDTRGWGPPWVPGAGGASAFSKALTSAGDPESCSIGRSGAMPSARNTYPRLIATDPASSDVDSNCASSGGSASVYTRSVQ